MSAEDNYPERMRHRLFTGALVLHAVASTALTALLTGLGVPFHEQLAAAVSVVLAPLLWLWARRTRSQKGPSWALLALCFAGVAVPAALFPTGVWVLSLPTTLCVPLLAGALLGRRVGAGVAGLLMAEVVALWALGAGSAAPPLSDAIYVVCTVGAMGFAAALTTLHDRVQQRTLGALTQALERAQRADEARKSSEATFRRLVEDAPLLVCIHRGGKILYANPAAVKTLGCLSADELIGRSTLSLLHPDDREVSAKGLGHAGREGVAPREERRFLRKDGSVGYGEVETIAIDHEGHPALVTFGRDITQRKLLDAHLTVTDRLASVGTLAAGVAHELNNPLAYVTANLGYLHEELVRCRREGVPLELEEWHAALLEARDGASRMKVIIQDLKTYARSADEAMGGVEVTAVVQETLKLAQNELRHRARLMTDLAPGACALGNAGRLGQVLLNILVNAAQAIPQGEADRHEVTVRSRVVGEEVVLEVSDTGCGIPPEHLRRIFDPFFTTKPIGIGTGLGLFICHNLISGMGGEMNVTSEVGRGTTVTLRLRRAEPPARRGLPEQAPQGPRTPPGRVLVIDDEALVGAAVQRSLLPHQVTVVTQAQDALALLRTGARYDAIFCDLMMPEMNGIAFYEQLALAHPEATSKVVFLTGGAFTVEAEEFLRGGVKCLTKPFDPSKLRQAVAELQAQSRPLQATVV
jgi:PAS domain S-box-containing protein